MLKTRLCLRCQLPGARASKRGGRRSKLSLPRRRPRPSGRKRGRGGPRLAGNGTGAVSRVLATSRRFHRAVRVNLTLAALYNVVAVGLAMAGVMTPLLCAVLMPISSLVLIGHTMAALRVDLAHLDLPRGGVDGDAAP